MAEEQGFAQARARLEEIVTQVRKKDTSLEQSLDLLEEGVRLANQCTELVDHSEWKPSDDALVEVAAEEAAPAPDADAAVAIDETPDDSLGGTDTAITQPDAEGVETDDEYDDIFADEE